MIDIFTRVAGDDYMLDAMGGNPIKERSDIFQPFSYNFNGRQVNFTWSLYQSGLEWLKYNSKNIYDVTADEFDDMIPYIGLTVVEFMTLIYQECAVNPMFFFSEICRIPMPGGGFDKPVLDIGKFCQINSFNMGYNSVLYNPRQSGSTMMLACLYNWVKMFRRWSANIIVPARARTDYDMFIEKTNLVKAGLPKVFFDVKIAETYHYSNNSKFINYLFINDFEFLSTKQYLYMNNINGIKTKTDIDIYPADIGFSTGVQIVANSTINKEPNEELVKLIQNSFVTMKEEDFCHPDYAFQRVKLPNRSPRYEHINPSDYYKYILEIRFDETHIMSKENLDRMTKILPPEYFDSEIRRIRPDIYNKKDDEK